MKNFYRRFGFANLAGLLVTGIVFSWIAHSGTLALAGLRISALQRWRQPLLGLLSMGGLVSWAVRALKGVSVHSYLYDLSVYSGSNSWLPLFDTVTAILHKGQCWPGGHASASFVLIAGYFALRETAPVWARRILVFSLLLGTAMSAMQIVRGGHFVSRNLWSLWFSWAVCMAVRLAIGGCRRLRGQAAALAGPSVTAEAVR